MKILLTAFDPFAGEATNPALEAVKLISGDNLDAEITKLEVPTVFGKSIQLVQEKMRAEKPDVVLCVGQAGGRFALTPERIAINIEDARIPDNEGNQPVDTKIFADGADAYFSNLPIKAIVQEIKKAGLPAAVSNTAGTFVCNHLMYGVLYTIAKNSLKIKGGFLHVPFLPEQVVARTNMPSMSLADIVCGIELALKAIIENPQDILETGGREF